VANGEKIASVVASAFACRRGEDTPSLATVTLAEAAMHMSISRWMSGPGLPREI
jgi:hypothetical protein